MVTDQSDARPCVPTFCISIDHNKKAGVPVIVGTPGKTISLKLLAKSYLMICFETFEPWRTM